MKKWLKNFKVRRLQPNLLTKRSKDGTPLAYYEFYPRDNQSVNKALKAGNDGNQPKSSQIMKMTSLVLRPPISRRSGQLTIPPQTKSHLLKNLHINLMRSKSMSRFGNCWKSWLTGQVRFTLSVTNDSCVDGDVYRYMHSSWRTELLTNFAPHGRKKLLQGGRLLNDKGPYLPWPHRDAPKPLTSYQDHFARSTNPTTQHGRLMVTA